MLTRDQVFAIADKYGAFEFGDAQGDKRQQFAADLIAAHQRMRDAAPELLALLIECRSFFENCAAYDGADTNNLDTRCMDAIAKATGAAQ